MVFKEGYIEITYNIAVVLNESGMLRNTYSNIIPNLISVMSEEEKVRSKFKNRYQFSSFTRTNIADLFDVNSIDFLANFDALFICTNATNDNEVLEKLKGNRAVIEQFINDGRGFFMGSQKRLSEREDVVSFLPEPISFRYVTRKEEKSSDGEIVIAKSDCDLVRNCSAEEINYICHHNRFKDHLYRSYMVPTFNDMFEDVLVDKHDATRKLLLRVKNQKVVYSTISLDYEEQNALLKNIIIYLTEGVPSVAFFCDINKRDFNFSDKFNNILLDARLNKLPLTIYDSLTVNQAVLSKSIYVVSSDYSLDSVRLFWKSVQEKSPVTDSNLKKLIYINESALTENILTEFRNYNDIDVRLRHAVQWVSETLSENTEKKEEKRKATAEKEKSNPYFKDTVPIKWGTSFWETYDTIVFLYELSQAYGKKYKDAIKSYGPAFLEQHLSHYRGCGQEELGSYDGMLNCSCALLELFVLFDLETLQKANENFSKYNIESTLNYIKQYLSGDHYLADIEMVIITLCNIRRYGVTNEALCEAFTDVNGELNYVQSLLKVAVEKLIIKYDNNSKNNKGYRNMTGIVDLQETCKDIEVIGYALNTYKNIFSAEECSQLADIMRHHLLQLKNLQTNGFWVNPMRTAAVLKALIRTLCLSDILNSGGFIVSSIISQVIISAFNFISNEIGRKTEDKNQVWMKDLMATVTIAYSLCLYNSQKRSIATEIEKTILNSADNISSIQVVDNSAIELTNMRNKLSRQGIELEDLTCRLKAAEERIQTHDAEQRQLKTDYDNAVKLEKNRFKKRRTSLVLVIVALAVLVIELFIVMVQGGLFKNFAAWMWSLVTTILAFGVSMLLKNLIENKLFPSDEKLFATREEKKKRKKQRKKKNSED